MFAVVFLEIHPFQDGNGRLSRILTTLLLLRSGYAYVPYSSLAERHRERQGGILPGAAPDAANDPQPAPDWQPWLGWFLRASGAEAPS